MYGALPPADAVGRTCGMGQPRRWAPFGQRRSSFEAITPKAPMTIGLPIALTNQGWERTCSSLTSGMPVLRCPHGARPRHGALPYAPLDTETQPITCTSSCSGPAACLWNTSCS